MPPRTLFADAFYWIALTFPRDAHHANVLSFSRTLGAVGPIRNTVWSTADRWLHSASSG